MYPATCGFEWNVGTSSRTTRTGTTTATEAGDRFYSVRTELSTESQPGRAGRHGSRGLRCPWQVARAQTPGFKYTDPPSQSRTVLIEVIIHCATRIIKAQTLNEWALFVGGQTATKCHAIRWSVLSAHLPSRLSHTAAPSSAVTDFEQQIATCNAHRQARVRSR